MVRPAPGVSAQVFVGSLWGSVSPVRVETALLGAEVRLEPGTAVVLPVEAGFEVGVLVDTGSVELDGTALAAADLGVVGAVSPAGVRLVAGDDGARVLVLGGEPFGEDIVMWWNFIGRSHEEVAEARAAWEAGGAGAERGSPDAAETGGPGRFGRVEGYEGPVARIPAPALPGVRLRPRGNRSRAPQGGAEPPAMS